MKKIILFCIAPIALFAQQTMTFNGVALQNVILPTPTSTALGGIQSITLSSNQWISYIDTSGIPHQSQPAFTNLNGSLACSQTPALTGDVATSSGSCSTTVSSIGGKSITLGGSFTTSGSSALTLTTTSTTNATLPSGTITLAQLGLNTFTKTQTDAVNTVASGATPTFDLSLGNVQYISSLGTNTSPSVTNITAGGKWKFVVCNNGTGGYTLTWPASVHGGVVIGTTASKCSVQTFVSPDGSTLFAENTGVINQ